MRVASIVADAGTLLGLGNSLYLAPRANQAILEMEQALETSQASYEIQPRVFYEDFRNFVLYVQDVRAGTGAANWRQVFMADVSDPANPIITTAASATVVNDNTQELMMRLRDGLRDETVADQPGQSNISTFTTTDMPLALSQQSDVHLGRMDTALYAMPIGALFKRIHGPDSERLPDRTAQPLRVSRRLPGADAGGRSAGRGFAARRQELRLRLHHSAGFRLLLSFLHRHRARASEQASGIPRRVVGQSAVCRGRHLSAVADGERRPHSALPSRLGSRALPRPKAPAKTNGFPLTGLLERLQPRVPSSKPRGIFPRILDEYVVREFVTMFLLVLAGFVLLMIVFTFFDLVGDILRNHIALTMVGEYLVNLTPSMLYQIAPLAVLIAALVTFGVLNRNSEIVAMKATGISLYRLVVPIVSIAACLAVSLFLFDQYYLPQANRRQEALRNIIKGRPPQTYLHPEQKWIFGQKPQPGEPGRIFYYEFFDPDSNEFANLSVFEFDPSTFQLTRRIFATRAVWDADTGHMDDLKMAGCATSRARTCNQYRDFVEDHLS